MVKVSWQRVIRWTLSTVTAVGVIVVMLLWLAGTFNSKISPREAAAARTTELGARRVATVNATTMPYSEWAVGSTQAVHETTLGSRLLAKVVAVNFHAGQLVQKDDILIELDDADLRAQLDQASAVVAAASATLDQAKIEYDRTKQLVADQAASPIEFTRVTNALRSAEADHQRAQKAREEAENRLTYATVRAPMAGRIVDKRVNVGDTVSPGQLLVSMYDNTRMRMVAVVRESLAAASIPAKGVGRTLTNVVATVPEPGANPTDQLLTNRSLKSGPAARNLRAENDLPPRPHEANLRRRVWRAGSHEWRFR